jgi:hypothetical protein
MNSLLIQIEKRYQNVFSTFFIWFEVHIQQFLGLKLSKKLNRGILGFLNKPTIPGNCIFPLANPHKWQSLDYVLIESIEFTDFILDLFR